MITDVAGVRVGHHTRDDSPTGCTVVLFPAGTVASGEVRGGAPATREFSLLEPSRRMSRLDAVVLSGGSAFGLAAADGVMSWCEERGLGHPTRMGVVPIVVGLSVFDLVGRDPSIRPGPDDGRAACDAAIDGPVALGAVGAGAGARVGPDRSRAGGIGSATERQSDLVVAALAVVNAAGLPAEEGPAPLAGFDPDGVWDLASPSGPEGEGNTTLVVVATNADLTKVACHTVAQGAHDGMARALDPPHTTVDGDAVVAAATGEVAAPLDVVRALTVRASARAVAAGISR